VSDQAGQANRTKSTSGTTVRVRVEHISGAQTNDMGATLVRTIGLMRARARIGMKTFACVCRLGQLGRLNPHLA
jgi:hypothetical protein